MTNPTISVAFPVEEPVESAPNLRQIDDKESANNGSEGVRSGNNVQLRTRVKMKGISALG